MEFINLFLHADKILASFFQNHGIWAYALLFLIIFIETGVVVFPFLPGDSLLFAAGTLAAGMGLNLGLLLVIVPLAAILGNTSNYLIGLWSARRVESFKGNFLVKPQDLAKAHGFFEKWGGWAITLCRFFPILRTIVPFVGGLSRMGFLRFTLFNVLGGVGWSFLLLLLGFFFGNLPVIKNNFTLMMLGIVALSLVPFVVALVKTQLKKRKEKCVNGSSQP